VSVLHIRGTATWGDEVDVQPLGPGNDRARRVASYVAKYATKSSAEHAGLEHRITSLGDLDRRSLPSHLDSMVRTAWVLGAEREFAHLRLHRHAHRLGYGGHFLTKSRTCSATFGALREARAKWRESRRHGDGPLSGPGEGRWRAIGSGWANQGEERFAGYQQRQRV
jgi:hypothetical protein